MSEKQLALLRLIAQGGYVPYVHQDYSTLAALYRRRFIRYGWMSVELTTRGSEALQIHAAKEAVA
jgi:hypothetical protein